MARGVPRTMFVDYGVPSLALTTILALDVTMLFSLCLLVTSLLGLGYCTSAVERGEEYNSNPPPAGQRV